MVVDSASPFDIDTNPLTINLDTNIKIDIDTAIDTAVGIAVPTVIDTIPSETEVDIAKSTIIDTASPSVAGLTRAVTIIDTTPSPAGVVSAVIGGFNMAFGLFHFHVDNDGVAEPISVSDSMLFAAAPSASPAIEGNPSMTIPLAPSEEEPRLETSTPSVGSNDFEDPPPSPSTAYCVDCDAYHYVGAGDFSSHEIVGCEDPRGGTAAIYPTISKCERALNALTLCPTPYDPDYIEGLYSDYTCSDDCQWILCRKNTGYHATDPKIRTQGAERGRSWIATKYGDGSLETSNAQRTAERETPSFTQVQGPRGEVKPLLPAFLYYDAIPREEYKVLVTEL
jgi:hypothetical protein